MAENDRTADSEEKQYRGVLVNILFIQTDQQRRDFAGCYGNSDIETPNIDNLARDGVTFDNCYTTIPICAPARASILTGLRPVHHGIVRNVESGSIDGRDFLHNIQFFTDEFHRLGYAMRHVGKWHVGTELQPEDCGLLGVFSRRTKYRILGNITSGFVAQEALSSRGTPSPNSAIITEQGIGFVARDGIFMTNCCVLGISFFIFSAWESL